MTKVVPAMFAFVTNRRRAMNPASGMNALWGAVRFFAVALACLGAGVADQEGDDEG